MCPESGRRDLEETIQKAQFSTSLPAFPEVHFRRRWPVSVRRVERGPARLLAKFEVRSFQRGAGHARPAQSTGWAAGQLGSSRENRTAGMPQSCRGVAVELPRSCRRCRRVAATPWEWRWQPGGGQSAPTRAAPCQGKGSPPGDSLWGRRLRGLGRRLRDRGRRFRRTRCGRRLGALGRRLRGRGRWFRRTRRGRRLRGLARRLRGGFPNPQTIARGRSISLARRGPCWCALPPARLPCHGLATDLPRTCRGLAADLPRTCRGLATAIRQPVGSGAPVAAAPGGAGAEVVAAAPGGAGAEVVAAAPGGAGAEVVAAAPGGAGA
eukprot:gene7845-biopygen40